jgi:hypothetical protein
MDRTYFERRSYQVHVRNTVDMPGKAGHFAMRPLVFTVCVVALQIALILHQNREYWADGTQAPSRRHRNGELGCGRAAPNARRGRVMNSPEAARNLKDRCNRSAT